MKHLPQGEFREFVSAHADRIYNHVFRMLGNREDAEEAVQDIFLKAHRGLTDFRGESSIRTWLYRITVNTCLTRLRNRRTIRQSRDHDGAEAGNLADRIADEGENPESRFMEQEFSDCVMRALDVISPEEKEILLLYHIDGFRYEEIANVLGVPIGTVCTRIYRARKSLRSAMNNVHKELRSL